MMVEVDKRYTCKDHNYFGKVYNKTGYMGEEFFAVEFRRCTDKKIVERDCVTKEGLRIHYATKTGLRRVYITEDRLNLVAPIYKTY